MGVGVGLGFGVGVGTGVGVGLELGDGEGVGVEVGLGVAVGVGLGVGEAVGVGVLVGVGVGELAKDLESAMQSDSQLLTVQFAAGYLKSWSTRFVFHCSAQKMLIAFPLQLPLRGLKE